MKSALLCLFLVPVVMEGVTISATVNCGSGPIGGSGVSSVSCTGANNAVAGASVSFESLGGDVSIFVGAFAGSTSLMPSTRQDVTANASFDADFLVTITGGTGKAFALPCVYATGDLDLAGGGQGTATAFVGNALGGGSAGSFTPITSGSCGTEMMGIPFTFGTPFVSTGEFSVSVDSPGPGQGPASGSAGTSVFGLGALGFAITDINGVFIPGTSFTISIVPELDTWQLMMLPVVLILIQMLRGKCRVAL